MKTLLAPTEDFIKRERGQLALAASAGSSVVLTMVNSQGFLLHDWVVVGREGSETAELCQITAVSGQTITVATLLLPHSSDEPVTKYRYNQRKFYGCLTAAGSFVELTGYGSPVTIQVDDPQGTILEYSGGEGYLYFKATYWNSYSSEETQTADANTVLADESVRYCSIYAIKKQAGLTNNPYVTDGVVETYRKRAESEVDSYLNAMYVLPLLNSSGIPEIPFLVENCTTLLAAGYMDWQEFGKDGEGFKWLGEARSILKKLQTPGGMQLLGSDKQPMQQNTLSSGVASYPDQVDNDNGPVRMFTTRQRF
jgi:hypothetical protein